MKKAVSRYIASFHACRKIKYYRYPEQKCPKTVEMVLELKIRNSFNKFCVSKDITLKMLSECS
jgi:hypothetical protein